MIDMYIAIGPNYWQRAETRDDAFLKLLKRMHYPESGKVTVISYDVPDDADEKHLYVDDFGGLFIPKGAVERDRIEIDLSQHSKRIVTIKDLDDELDDEQFELTCDIWK